MNQYRDRFKRDANISAGAAGVLKSQPLWPLTSVIISTPDATVPPTRTPITVGTMKQRRTATNPSPPTSSIVVGLVSTTPSAMTTSAPLHPRGLGGESLRKSKYVPRSLAQHSYTDRSSESLDERDYLTRGGANMLFPLKLYLAIDRIEAEGHGHICSWQPHGRAFIVHKQGKFENIMPEYFGKMKISSFQRQLNLYGFMRLTHGLDKGGYYHEYFLRGRMDLAHRIQRTRIKGTRLRAASNPDMEPNFYAMMPVGVRVREIVLAMPKESYDLPRNMTQQLGWQQQQQSPLQIPKIKLSPPNEQLHPPTIKSNTSNVAGSLANLPEILTPSSMRGSSELSISFSSLASTVNRRVFRHSSHESSLGRPRGSCAESVVPKGMVPVNRPGALQRSSSATFASEGFEIDEGRGFAAATVMPQHTEKSPSLPPHSTTPLQVVPQESPFPLAIPYLRPTLLDWDEEATGKEQGSFEKENLRCLPEHLSSSSTRRFPLQQQQSQSIFRPASAFPAATSTATATATATATSTTENEGGVADALFSDTFGGPSEVNEPANDILATETSIDSEPDETFWDVTEHIFDQPCEKNNLSLEEQQTMEGWMTTSADHRQPQIYTGSSNDGDVDVYSTSEVCSGTEEIHRSLRRRDVGEGNGDVSSNHRSEVRSTVTSPAMPRFSSLPMRLPSPVPLSFSVRQMNTSLPEFVEAAPLPERQIVSAPQWNVMPYDSDLAAFLRTLFEKEAEQQQQQHQQRDNSPSSSSSSCSLSSMEQDRVPSWASWNAANFAMPGTFKKRNSWRNAAA